MENFSYHSVSDEAVHEPRLEFSQFVRGGSEFAFDQVESQYVKEIIENLLLQM